VKGVGAPRYPKSEKCRNGACRAGGPKENKHRNPRKEKVKPQNRRGRGAIITNPMKKPTPKKGWSAEREKITGKTDWGKRKL